MRPAIAALAILTLTACGGMSFRPRTGPGTPGTGPFPGPDPALTGGRVDAREASPTVRRACRSSAAPRGWIAIDYLRLGEECPNAEAHAGYNGVLLERFDGRARGTRLDVCVDQPTPHGWIRQGPGEAQCHGARADPGEPTTKRISRVP